MELTTIGALAISYVFVYAIGKSERENKDDVIEIEDVEEDDDDTEDISIGRTVIMSCQTCRKLKRHREIKKDLYQCIKCKRHVDLR